MVSIEFSKKSQSDFFKYLEDLKGEIADYVRAEIESSMLKIEEEATKEVRVDTSALKNSIQSTPIKVSKNEITGGVEVGAFYAPYIEFGTGGLVKIPSELSEFASQFKGTTGRERNYGAKPFFYPEVFRQRKELPKNIDRTLAALLKKKQ
jgi:hypothetical protein